MILFLLLKAYQPGLFDEQVTVSGHATKKGTYVQPYQAKRKKRHDEPQAGDLFAEADRKEFQRKYPNFGTKYVVQPSGFPDGKLKVINDEGETERFGAPMGEMSRRFNTVEQAAAAMEKWLSKQKKKGATFAEAPAPKPKEPEKKPEPADELIREHARLVKVLRSPSHADDLKEADEQERELKEYRKKRKRMKKALLVAPLTALLKARAHG